VPSTSTSPTTDAREGALAPSGPGRLLQRVAGEGAAVAAHLASLVVGYLALWVLLLGTWFHGDDFEFLANRVGDDPVAGIWAAHVEHWSTAPILIWKVLYAAFGMDSAAPYFAVQLLVHVISAHLLWRLIRRAGAHTWVATGLAASFLVLGSGWDNITWAFQVGFIGSLALGLGSLLLVLRGTGRAFVLAVALSVLSLTFSGVSITFAIAGALTLLLMGRVVRAVVLGLVTGGVYLSWYALNTENIRPPEHGSSPVDRLSNAPRWAWQLLGSSYESYTAVIGAGAVLALLLVGFFVWRVGDDAATWRAPADDPRRVQLAALTSITGTALLQVASFAVNRNDISTPDTSRYLYFVIGLSLPLLGVVLSRFTRSPWQTALVGGILVYLVIEQGLLLVSQERQYESPQLQHDTLGLAALIEAGEPVDSVALAVDVNTTSITKWVEEEALGTLSDVPAQYVLDARGFGQVASHPDQPADTTAATVRPAAGSARGTADGVGDGAPLGPGACAATSVVPGSVAATVSLQPGTTVAVTVEDGTSLVYRVLQGDARSRTIGITVPVNGTRWLTSRTTMELELVADSGQDLTVCAP